MKIRRRRTRRLGQNFLVDRNVVDRIVAALDPRPGEPVLEIGPGHGALTGSLIAAAGRIAAVELDQGLALRLTGRHDADQLIVIAEDILQVDLPGVSALLGGTAAAGLVVAGNLPYSVSKPIVRKLVDNRHVVERAVLMFQKEVALRLTARPGEREYGPLTVRTGLAFDVRRIFDVGPAAFRPRPKVDSTVTYWRRRPISPLDDLDLRLQGCLTASFGRRRQTLRNNLRASLGAAAPAEALLRSAGLDGSRRAETLAPEEFVTLAEHWPG